MCEVIDTELDHNYKGKVLAIETEQIDKLGSPEGCEITMRSKNTIYDMDDHLPSDYDSDDSTNDKTTSMTVPTRLNNVKSEYLSIVLNANRDMVDISSDSVSEKQEAQAFFNVDMKKSLNDVVSRYKSLGKYDQLLEDQNNPFVEISPGRVYKRNYSGGLEMAVTDDCVVAYNYALWHEDNPEPFDSTWLRHQVMVSDLSTDSLMPGIRELLLTCKKNECCEAIIRPDAAFGKLGAMPRIPQNATIFCLLEVIKVIYRDQLPPLPGDSDEVSRATFEDLHNAADSARTRGNYYHDVKDYNVAMQRYKAGVRILESITYKSEEEEMRGTALLCKLYLNLARVCYMTGKCRLALTFCKEASMIEPDNIKVFHHKMKAWDLMGQHERALGTAHRALQLCKDPGVYKIFRREAQKLNEKIKEKRDESKQLYKLMGKAYIN